MPVRRIMVRYRVKAGEEERNEALVRAVYRELEERQTPGIRYATFKLDDGRTFVHLASVETDDGQSPLTELNAFDEFQRAIRDRCDQAPVVSRLDEVGAFRWLGD